MSREVGRYRVLRRLGETDFGVEHLASFNTAGGLPSAARLLVVGERLSEHSEAALLKLRPVLALHMGGTIRLLDAGVADGAAYLAYEFLPTRDLAAVLSELSARAEVASLKAVLHLVTEVATTLRSLERQGRSDLPLGHGRLGPESILLTADGQVRLHYVGLAGALGLEPRRLAGGASGEVPLGAHDARALGLLTRDLLLTDRGASPRDAAEAEELLALREGPFAYKKIQGLSSSAELLAALESHPTGAEGSVEAVASLMERLFGEALATERQELDRLLAAGSQRPEAEPPRAPVKTSGTLDLSALDEPMDPGPVTPPPMSVIAGRYVVEGVLGRGGMGNVLLAEHLDLGRRVALKLLHPKLSHDPQFAERFRREARAACKIGHRNIVDVLDFGRTADGRLFSVMELLEGESLDVLLEREGALEQTRAIRIVLQVCDALDAAHEVSVVHRDLKPDNLMITIEPDGTELVRVVDFGIAQDDTSESARVTKTGQIVGTPSYMSPEQVRGHETDLRTDVYSSGAILYELVTGHLVFEAETVIEVMGAHLKEEPKPPTERASPSRAIHPMLDEVVLRALAKKREERYQTMAELAFDLWTVLEKIKEEGPRGLAPPAPPIEPRSDVPAPSSDDEASKDEPNLTRRATRWASIVAAVAAIGLTALILGALTLGWNRQGATIASSDHLPATLDAAVDEAAVEGGLEADDEAGVVTSKARRRKSSRGGGASRRRSSSLADFESGQQLLRQRQPAKAAAAFQRVLRGSPGNAAALAGLGQAEFELGQHAAAVRHLKRAVQLRPTSNRYRLLLAGALLRSGDRAAAREHYGEVLRRDPNNAVAKRMVSKLR